MLKVVVFSKITAENYIPYTIITAENYIPVVLNLVGKNVLNGQLEDFRVEFAMYNN